MSRQLPARPSLEHLKKQAKDLLVQLQHDDPAAQLADAQHALAREYGFASWPKLKSHVEAESTVRPSPFSGTWKVNTAKSQRHPAQDFQSAIVEFAVEGENVRITDVVVDAAGREERRVNAILVDGQEHAAQGGNGYTLTSMWREARVLEAIARQHGEIVGSVRYEVSSDGTVLTVAADQMLIVFDRLN